jgi:hypothetical protein
MTCIINSNTESNLEWYLVLQASRISVGVPKIEYFRIMKLMSWKNNSFLFFNFLSLLNMYY